MSMTEKEYLQYMLDHIPRKFRTVEEVSFCVRNLQWMMTLRIREVERDER